MKAVTLESPAVAPALAASRLSDFSQLVKARLTLLVLITTAVGFYLGAPLPFNLLAFFHVLIGAALAAGGASALNQWWERDFDALMERTRERPVPAGRMRPRDALVVGCAAALAGVVYLAVVLNLLAAALTAATVLIYIFAYTPLKRLTPTNTLVGAIPGALPPLIGWAAATGSITLPSLSLFGVLFFWQMPHFFAISWLYREQYRAAGFRMLSNADTDGLRSGRQAAVYALALVGASVFPAWLGVSTRTLLPVEIIVAVIFFATACLFARQRNRVEARRLFFASIIFLPLFLGLLVISKT